MHIRVVNDIAGTEQTRAYADYRMFVSLACFSPLVEDVEVHLISSDGNGADVCCVVSLHTTSGKSARVRAQGTHAYDAINRAAERMSQRLWELANAERLIRHAR